MPSKEGAGFLKTFYEKYGGQSPDPALETLLRGIRLTPYRLRVIYRFVRPDGDFKAFSAFLNQLLPKSALARAEREKLFAELPPDKFSLSDRGYLARLHPLELWLLQYLGQHPQAPRSEVLAQSAAERQEVYRWLFRPARWEAQNKRIRILMEEDAFLQIAKAWQRLGYPFENLVPSYATAIGVSGDTPKALAEVAGILLNDGVRHPAVSIRELQFAQQTPMETSFSARPAAGEQVLPR